MHAALLTALLTALLLALLTALLLSDEMGRDEKHSCMRPACCDGEGENGSTETGAQNREATVECRPIPLNPKP
jgi:hypothetical protein